MAVKVLWAKPHCRFTLLMERFVIEGFQACQVVLDRFHGMQHMTEALDTVRRCDSPLLIAEDDGGLKGTNYRWISSKENVTPTRQTEFRFLQGSDLKTRRAWAVKEDLRHLWSFRVLDCARRFFSQWSGLAMVSRVEPVKAVARMIDRRLDNIITYCRHQLTIAVAEGLNSKIMAITRRAADFRNVDNFKDVIYSYCGGLRLYQ